MGCVFKSVVVFDSGVLNRTYTHAAYLGCN
jgi:hypothetical protein